MALSGINPSRPRQQGPDTMTRIAQGLDIAKNVLGIALEIPQFKQRREALKTEQAKTISEIGANTEEAKPGEEGAFEVPGLGIRRAVPSMQRTIQELTVKSKQAEATTPTEDEYKAFIKISPGSDLQTLKQLYPTRGDLRDANNRILGATTIKMEEPMAREKFTYEQTEKEKAAALEKAQRYVPSLKQYTLTKEDAKDAKDALAQHDSIKKSLSGLIDLRNKYGGGTVTDREDVARAQQIATKLLLKYKKMEQLGVLSKTDMDLIDQLIPKNPLEVNPSGLIGQDPTMAKLQQLLTISDDDMEVFLTTKGLVAPGAPTHEDFQKAARDRGLIK